MTSKQTMDLTFVLGQNQKTGGPQWRSEEKTDHTTTVRVPDVKSALQPSLDAKRFKCFEGHTVFVSPNQHFRIVSVYLMEAIPEEIEFDFELEFKRGKHPKTRLDQWESRVYDKDRDHTTLFLCDRNSRLQPTMNGEKFGCVEGEELFNDEISFRIVLVNLVAKLDPERILVTYSEAIRKAMTENLGVIGTISRIKHGRSADKRLGDAQLRSKMKNGGRSCGSKKEKKQKSA